MPNGGTPLAASPVAPLLKNQDSPDNLKRAVDKRPKKIPLARVAAVRQPKARNYAGRSTGGGR